MAYEIVKTGDGERDHFCSRPSWFSRWRKHMRAGTVVQCECGKRWELYRSNITNGLFWRNV